MLTCRSSTAHSIAHMLFNKYIITTPFLICCLSVNFIFKCNFSLPVQAILTFHFFLYFRVCPQTPLGSRPWKWSLMILVTGRVFSWDIFILLTMGGEKMSDLWLQNFTFFFVYKAHSPSWVRRSKRLMPTKFKQKRKKRRRPELNTRSPKKPFRGSWKTMRRWHLPPDISKCCGDLTVNHFFPCIDS